MSRISLFGIAFFIFFIGVVSLRAQKVDADSSLGQRLAEFGKLDARLVDLFSKKEYEKAADICRQQMKLVPDSGEPHYNLACAEARMDQKNDALLELGMAVDLGFSDSYHMHEDEDLASLRDEDKFKALLKKARDKELNAPHETTSDVAGVKTVEGFPEGGLRYRLRISPDATAAKPARLLIWFHPSGGLMDSTVEALAPRFAKAGYALLVFTQKNYSFWSESDIKALTLRTLPEVKKIEGLDARKPILMGFSAGGQLALDLWLENPRNYGGLVLDAAYPIDPKVYAETGTIKPLTPPENDAIKSCPIFALVGGDDGGLLIWKKLEKSWHEAQVPLTLHIVPGEGHAWIFTATEIVALDEWLKRVAAGEKPSEAPAKTRPGENEDGAPVKVLNPAGGSVSTSHRV